MDDKIVSYLKFLESSGSLNDTVILLHSDHGLNLPGFYTLVDADDFFVEKTLPTLFLITPQKLAQKYKKILKDKENMFLTPYDIHNTFLHLANAPESDYNKLGESLFKHINETGRNCDMFNIRDPYCNCLGERGNK